MAEIKSERIEIELEWTCDCGEVVNETVRMSSRKDCEILLCKKCDKSFDYNVQRSID